MHHILFLQDLAVVMIAAALATILFRQLKQPVVLGYILAGLIIGPHTPPFTLIADERTIEIAILINLSTAHKTNVHIAPLQQ